MAEDKPAQGSILGNCLPARYIFAFLGNIGMAIVYGLKVNLSVTMVAMVNHSAVMGNETESQSSSGVEECEPPEGFSESSDTSDGPFEWSEPLQGTLLSCYFWGYMVSQVPLGRIAEIFSAKWVFFFSVALNVICTLGTPPLTKLHYGGLIAMRVLEGFAGGASFPAMHIMIANWAPETERMLIATLIYVGTSVGTASSILMSGMLCHHFGWEYVFYIMGGLSCIWMFLWICLVQSDPNQQRFISPEEREMINSSLGKTGNETRPKMPWGKVFTSCPFWSILIAHTCSNVGWYMFLIEIPFYMKQVLKFNVKSNAALSAAPYIPALIFSICLSKILDSLQNKGTISRTAARKIATFFCSVVPAGALVGLCFIGCRHYFAVGIVWLCIISMGATYPGFLSNHMDIAPNFAGTLMGMTNTIASLPGILVPLCVGYLTQGNQTIEAWQKIFGLTIITFLIEFFVYTIFGTGQKQDWNDG